MLAMISCRNSTGSTDAHNLSIDSATTETKKENGTELTEEKSRSHPSTNESDFEVPKGYTLFERIQGDLNGDGIEDHVLIIKGTEKENIVVNRFDEEVDRNRRGILVYLSDSETYFLATKNLSCFSSENEDGGVYFPPEFSISIENGKLYFHYGHGRYGYWKYTFRYQNADFELIGYDSSSNYGPIINRETSINFLTKRKLTRENVNQDTEDSGDEIFEETWEDIDIQKLYRLSEITAFDELDVTREN